MDPELNMAATTSTGAAAKSRFALRTDALAVKGSSHLIPFAVRAFYSSAKSIEREAVAGLPTYD